MSLFSPAPIVSIVVPCCGDETAFENTLVSVLENRPQRCEVIVAHDGSYTDPFDLGDEVRFALATRSDLPALVRAGADQARGQLVHVLAEGYEATDGWLDELLASPDETCPDFLAPVSLQSKTSSSIATIGWAQRAGGFCTPVAVGQSVTSLPRRLATQGPILQASIWRTDLLRVLSSLPTGNDSQLTQYAWSVVAESAGRNCQTATHCRVIEGRPGLGYGSQSAFTARHMQAVRCIVDDRGTSSAVLGGLVHLATNFHRPSAYSESLGRLTAPMIQSSYQPRFAKAMRNALQTLEEAVDDATADTLAFPAASRAVQWTPQRRAA